MRIHLIVADPPGHDQPWVVTAWDEWTVDENHSGYLEAIEEAKKNKTAEIREATVEVISWRGFSTRFQ